MAQRNINHLVVNGVQDSINQIKMEIAQELGVKLGPETASRDNGTVGGEITKRLVSLARSQLK